jgi:hypothetical protein
MLITLSPEKALRIIVILCLASMGAAMISVASHPGDHSPPMERARELIGYFFLAVALFSIFYLQYRAATRYLKVELNPALGYLQALGSFLFLLIGAAGLLAHREAVDPQIDSGFHTNGYLTSIAILGEAVFLGNIVWTYLRQPRYVARPLADISAPAQIVPSAAPLLSQAAGSKTIGSARLWGWPQSPVRLFGITAGFLICGGLAMILYNAPSFKLVLPWPGPPRFVSFGLYLWIGALPFALFALLYWISGGRHGRTFNDKLNRFHFWVAIIGLIDSVRLATTWVMSHVSRLAADDLRRDALEVGSLFCLALLIAAANIIFAERRSASSLLSRSLPPR